jgi:hypothetical protein
MNVFRSARESENFHIVLWLVKDLCWALTWKALGLVLAPPTVALAAWIAWRRRNEADEFLHALAVVFWITANSLWMVGEFFFQDRTRPYSVVLFAAGIGCVGWYYLVLLPKRANDKSPLVEQRT